ncbi:UNC93-like protein [Stegodyphus dumicola]|uniref:UNC93-like protein n=1 Tax=Stegodyphus dumicola TaxID=202533 RepID=UPI0015ACE870|nr:UNC93-like protein [Stegodyphus dumicola]
MACNWINQKLNMSEKYCILKNLLSLAFGHFLVMTAFDSLSNLQSTVNEKEGIGVASQATIYAFFTLSAFFLPPYLIKRFGCKKTLVISIFSVAPYVAANMYPCWGTLIPTAMLTGMAYGPYWTARSTYINELCYNYSTFSHASISVISAWFFGIFSFFHENAEICGNLISYYVLSNQYIEGKFMNNETLHSNSETKYIYDGIEYGNEEVKKTNNITNDISNKTIFQCGATFCGEILEVATNPNLQPPSDAKWYTLTAIYFTLVIVAALVVIFIVDSLDEKNNKSKHPLILFATFKQMKNTNQILLIPLAFYCGLADGFYNSDFTRAFIACAWGISQVGYVTICYGVVCAVTDCSVGSLVKYLRRPTVFIIAAISHFAVFTSLLVWAPGPDNFMFYYALAGIYGIGASVWWSQITAFYGIIFAENADAAFSTFYFWCSLGFTVAFAYSDILCTSIKIYTLLGLLFVSVIGYIIAEIC